MKKAQVKKIIKVENFKLQSQFQCNMKEKAKEIYRKMMESDFCSQWMGIELMQIKQGDCHLRMKVKKEMLNGFGTLHGGMAYAFADSALAFACNSYGRVSPLIQGSMNYIKSAKEGDILEAKAKVRFLGNKKADVDVEIFCNSQLEPYYLFRGTVYRTTKEHLY